MGKQNVAFSLIKWSNLGKKILWGLVQLPQVEWSKSMGWGALYRALHSTYDEEGDQPSGSVILYCTKPNEQDKAAVNVQKWMQIELSKTLN